MTKTEHYYFILPIFNKNVIYGLNCALFVECKMYVLLQPIVYEGQDKNPEMCRVLLTHEVMCR